MPISTRTNIASLGAMRALGQHTHQLGEVFQRLSSGLRINKASDDAAGLAVSESLRAKSQVYAQGVRNLNDGISLLNIADGALGELTNIVTKLKELSTQSASGSLSGSQRSAINTEAQALSDEYTRLARGTKFNGISLFDGDLSDLRLQAGFGNDGGIASGIGGAIFDDNFSTVSFGNQTGNATRDVALADINGDGHVDMLNVGQSTSVRVQLGDGTGGFGSITTYTLQNNGTTKIELFDIDHDGNLDVVAAGRNAGVGDVAVLLGNGDGTFQSAVHNQLNGSMTYGIDIADVNGDGLEDIVSTGYSGVNETFHIAYGNGDGTFQTAITIDTTINTQGYALALGDINNDGKLDFVSNGTDGGSGYAYVYTQDANGNFNATGGFQTSTYLGLDVELADINGDGNLDVLTTGTQSGYSSGQVTVRLGNGDGTFGSGVEYQMNDLISFTTELADLNGDGVLDIVTSGTNSSGGGIGFRYGVGDGTFGDVMSFDSGEVTLAYSVSLADLNEDGVLDIATGGHSAGTATGGVHLASTSDGVSSLLPFDLSTLSGARSALHIFDYTLDNLTLQRGEIGAFVSRINSTINTTRTTSDSLIEARGRIVDADIATETTALVSLQIKQQGAAAILAQANQQPSLAIQLLGG
ncbi:MAG: VCBS repeat-containing protein [Bdellovibrionales bacterium]|nr:VCBS repeat-containing protein [Bdellovibrionales bacterium]